MSVLVHKVGYVDPQTRKERAYSKPPCGAVTGKVSEIWGDVTCPDCLGHHEMDRGRNHPILKAID